MTVKPIMKWVGGKRELLPELRKHIPSSFDKETNTYYEPFIGGGALLFDILPHYGVINDSNEELINLYTVVKNDVDSLIREVSSYPYDKDFYYSIRELDRKEGFPDFLSDIQRAARTLYLNKTCFNGLYRVNKKGQFNTPFGKYSNPTICKENDLKDVSSYFNDNDISIMSGDFAQCVKDAQEGDFVYLDPPYVPLSKTSSFTSYTKEGFEDCDQKRIKSIIDDLSNNGVYVLMSNSSSSDVFDLYSSDYNIETVKVARKVNSKAHKRNKIDEFLIKNY